MKRTWLAGVMLMVGLLCPAIGFSNVAAPPDRPPEPPRPVAKQAVPFKITGDRTAEEHRLVIPRKFLENAQAARVKGAGIPGSDVRTMIAGLAISVSVVSLVLLVIRKKSRAAQAVAVFVALGGGGWIWMNYASADVAPPYSEIPQNWKGQVSVTIEITDQGDVVELILGTDRRHTEPPSRREPVPPNTGSAAPSQPKSEPPTSESAPKANPE